MTPHRRLVVRVLPSVLTPRSVMQLCSASMTTPTPLDKNPNGRFGLGLRRLRHSPVSRIVLFGPVKHLGQGHTTKGRGAIRLPGHSELHWTFPCTDRGLLV